MRGDDVECGRKHGEVEGRWEGEDVRRNRRREKVGIRGVRR